MVSTFTGIFTKKQFVTSDVATVTFTLKNKNRLDFSPGQYLIMHIPPRHGGEEDKRRIFSLINTPGTREFEFLAKIIPGGVASEFFMHLKKNDEVIFQGPAGMFVMRDTQKPKLFAATGTGIAPVISILRTHLAGSVSSFTLVWGLKSKEDTYLLNELEELTGKHPNFNYFICLSREVTLEAFDEKYRDNVVLRGRINPKIDELLSTFNSQLSTEYYISGDRNIVEDIRQHLLAQGVAKEAISFEKFV